VREVTLQSVCKASVTSSNKLASCFSFLSLELQCPNVFSPGDLHGTRNLKVAHCFVTLTSDRNRLATACSSWVLETANVLFRTTAVTWGSEKLAAVLAQGVSGAPA
jgi:hypothetical protein